MVLRAVRGRPVGDGVLLDELAAFAGVFFKVALVFELRAHVAGHVAVAAPFSKTAWLACLFGALALLGRWAARAIGAIGVIAVDVVGVHVAWYSVLRGVRRMQDLSTCD